MEPKVILEFGPNDKFFTIKSYVGCDICLKNDGYYSFFTEDGSIITELKYIPMKMINTTFMYHMLFLCGSCSKVYDIKPVKIGEHKYFTDSIKTFEIPLSSKQALKAIKNIKKYSKDDN